MSTRCNNFWLTLPRPILALAPMAGVTDLAFRTVCKEFGADVVYTEFASIDALLHGNQATRDMIQYRPEDQPVVAQIFGNDPHKYFQACKILEELGFAGIDINFGCPAYKVVKNGGGVSLMRNLPLCREIVQACCEAVNIPISIKIRSSINAKGDLCEIDYNIPGTQQKTVNSPLRRPPRIYRVETGIEASQQSPGTANSQITALDLINAIKGLPVAAIMIHARSYEKPFDGSPDMDMITKAKKIFPGIVLGNGGVYSPEQAKEMLETTECDGIGIGRGSHGRPWMFKQIKEYLSTGAFHELSWVGKKNVILRHAQLALSSKGIHGIVELRKHLMWYAKGIPQASAIRQQLTQISSLESVSSVLSSI